MFVYPNVAKSETSNLMQVFNTGRLEGFLTNLDAIANHNMVFAFPSNMR
jgi:hypothetical protein